MNHQDVVDMFDGISANNKEILARRYSKELSATLVEINKSMIAQNLDCKSLVPPPNMIMNAFKYCDLDDIRVVLLGQDPYPDAKNAIGLSFSVPADVKLPVSLRNIFKCLLHYGLIKSLPEHGDLTNWCKQGILLVNCALTTVVGKSNAHESFWRNYTNAILDYLSISGRVIFILLGGFAHAKKQFCKGEILEWGHPSGLNSVNNEENNPKNFKFCDAFIKTNDILISRGESPIQWDPRIDISTQLNSITANPTSISTSISTSMQCASPLVATTKSNTQREPVPIDAGKHAIEPISIDSVRANSESSCGDVLWLFTDGGSRANGKKNCRASWAYYITDKTTSAQNHGLVPEKTISGKIFTSSNNRGELMGIQMGLEFIEKTSNNQQRRKLVVVSDSEYSIGCLSEWIHNWLANPTKHKMNEKKNLDIILPTKETMDKLKNRYDIVFKHVNSHRKEPVDIHSESWFLWKCNDIVDKLCTTAFDN